MVRPERRVVLAGASPARVSGSRLQPSGVIRPRRAECQKALKERGANQRAATTGERRSLVILSLKGVRKAEPLISRRRQQTASWTGRDAGPLRGLRRWHVGTEQGGTGEILPGSLVRQRPSV